MCNDDRSCGDITCSRSSDIDGGGSSSGDRSRTVRSATDLKRGASDSSDSGTGLSSSSNHCARSVVSHSGTDRSCSCGDRSNQDSGVHWSGH